MLKSIADTVSAGEVEWHHTRGEIVEGVEQVFAAVKEREDAEQELLESIWDVVEKLAELAGPAFEWPILIGVAGAFAPFAAIGAGYMAAADEIKQKEAAMGFAEGVALGVMAETPENVRDYFWREHPLANPVFPAGGQIAQYYFNAALVLGYANGKELLARDLAAPFWADIRNHLTRTFGDPQAEGWGRREWIDYYIAVATAFYKGHIGQ